MKKMMLLFMFLFAVVSIALGQVTDTTAAVTYNLGDSFTEFLAGNAWTIAFVAFFLFSEWLGQTGKLKEGSVWALILNWIGKILRNKGAVVKSKKGKYMKILIIGIMLSGLGLAASAQSWNGFFKPIDKDLFGDPLRTADRTLTDGVWLFRPAVEITAIQLMYNKEEKRWDASALTQGGLGIGYQHFIEVNGEPYNNLGINALLLLDVIPMETTKTAISGALTVNALQLLNFGIGYHFGLDQAFLLTGVILNFN